MNWWRSVRRHLRVRRLEPSTGIGVAIIAAGTAILIAGQVHHHGWTVAGFFDDIYPNLGSELVGIAFVILIVDTLSRRREEQRLKQQLIREMSSSDHGLTARAVLSLEARGWLHDGALANASLAGANLVGAGLEMANLTGAVLAGANLEHANLSKATLTNCNMSGAQLRRVNVEMADLEGCNLADAVLDDADMARSRLVDANLAGASLRAADLDSADLTRADLRGADLTGARLTGTMLVSVRYDDRTVWPDEFAPGPAR